MTKPNRTPLAPEDEVTSDILLQVSRLHRLAAVGEATEVMVAESAAARAAEAAANGRAADADAARVLVEAELADTHASAAAYREDSERKQADLHDQVAEQTERGDALEAELAEVRAAAEAERNRLNEELEAVRAEVAGAHERGRAEAQAEFPPMLRLAAQEADREARETYASALSSANTDETASTQEVEGVLRDALIDSPSTSAWATPRLEAKP